jgi:hypothetical protein
MPGLVAADGLAIAVGDPSVPISVWRVAGTSQPTETGTANGLTPRLAALLVGMCTGVGDTIVDLTVGPAFVGAAGARRCRSVVDPVDFTGLGRLDRTVGLVVRRWPPAATDTVTDTPATLTGLLFACRQLPAGAGCTVVALVSRSPGSNYLDQARLLISAAHNAGVDYLHHIVAVTTPPTASPIPPRPAARADPPATMRAHARASIDLLVLVVRRRSMTDRRDTPSSLPGRFQGDRESRRTPRDGVCALRPATKARRSF